MLPKFYYFIYAGTVTLINYVLIYRKRKHASDLKLLNPYVVIVIILLGYVLMGVGGSIVREMH